LSKELILIVDDEKAICDILAQMLKSIGYTTVSFYDFKTAEDHYEKNYDSVDLVIMDLRLPDIQGEDAVVKLTQINPDVKVIILSGYITSTSQSGSALGVRRMVQKPVNMAELETVVKEVLDE